MDPQEKELSEKRKRNMKLTVIHKALTYDLLFFYGIKFLFLAQVKNISASDIVLASAFYGIFKAIFQIPGVFIIDKIGTRKSLILADLINAISIIFVMFSTNLWWLIITNLFFGLGFAIRDVAEAGMLHKSIPDTENRGKTYSKVDGRGLGDYYYMSAISAVVSGFLFNINPYIPLWICIAILLISALIATKFKELDNLEQQEDANIGIFKRYKIYFKDLRLAFSFIFTSRRLKALMLYAGVMYGIIAVMSTYEMGLLEEISMSASVTGIIYAIMQMIAGISSKLQNKFHEKFKKKALTVIGISYTIACLIAGLISITTLPYIIVVGIILTSYVIRYLDTGFFHVLMKKYITNFTNAEVANKVYSAYSLVAGLGTTAICALGSVIVSYNNSIRYSMIIFGIAFLVVILLMLLYMKDRVGLEPEKYRKKDINYKEYISLK